MMTIKHYTQEELMTLSIHMLTALEATLRHELDQLDPNGQDAEDIRQTLAVIAKVCAMKRYRRPSP